MNEKLESLKPLLKSGDYEKAADILKEYRAEFPNDWDGKLMEGIIAQLRGDEETFRRIHDEAQAVMDGHGLTGEHIKASPLWKKYHSSWKKVATVAVIGLVAGGGLAGGAYYLNARLREAMQTVVSAFQGNSMPRRKSKDPKDQLDLYGGPQFYEKEKIESHNFEIRGEIQK